MQRYPEAIAPLKSWPVGVLLVNTVPYVGGAERSLLTLMVRLDSERYRPYLVTTERGMLSEQAHKLGIPVILRSFPWLSRRRPWKYASSIRSLVGAMRDQRIGLVHTNCDRSLGHVNWACRWAGVPYVSHVRDCVRGWFMPQHLAALNRARRVIANSEALARVCVENGVTADLIEVIYSPVDVARFREARTDAGRALRAASTIDQDAFVIGLVGQVQDIKGHEELVQAAPTVLAQVPSAHFVIVGSAFTDTSKSFLIHLQRSIHGLGLSGRFHFLGFRDDIPAVMRALDLLVAPSRSEAFGRVVVEGLAAGLPVIGAKVGGIPEIIEDGKNGVLVPPGNVDALAEAIVRIAENSSLRDALAQRGPEVAQMFSVGHHVARVQALYDSILGGSEEPSR